MTPDQVLNSYARMLRERVTVRRYTGVGTNRPKTDIANVRARVTEYQPNELVGTITQGDRKAIIYAPDVAAGGISALTLNDKIVVYGRELAIFAIDNATRRIDGQLIAYELQLRG